MEVSGTQEAAGRNARREVVMVALGGAVVLALKTAFALTLPGPWYLPDEITYVEHARHIVFQGEVFYQGPGGGVQPGWPLALAPVMGLFSARPHVAYVAGVCLSSLLGTLVIFPVFFLARRWLSSTEALLVAAVAVTAPGACLYGWAMLTEPMYTLVLALAAACFVRAIYSARGTDFAGAGALAGLSFWVRPFGLAAVLGCVAGAAVWGLRRRRWQEPAWTLLASGLVVAASFLAGLVARPQSGLEVTLTNYPYESQVTRVWWSIILSPSGWAGMGLAAARDIGYLLVAGFSVFLPLSMVALARGLTRPNRASAAGRAMLCGGACLFGVTLGLTALAQMSRIDLERMYGRYLEPLVSVVMVAGAVTWAKISQSPAARWRLLVLAVVLVLALAVVIPQGKISFTNNPGFWYWNLLYRYAGSLVALAVLVGLWGLFSALHRKRTVALVGILGLSVLSTALVAWHVRRYNAEVQPLREAVEGVCVAATREGVGDSGMTLWVDPTLLAGPRRVVDRADVFVSWLRYGLANVRVCVAGREEIATVGDLVLSHEAGPNAPVLWSKGGLALFRVGRPSSSGISFPGGTCATASSRNSGPVGRGTRG